VVLRKEENKKAHAICNIISIIHFSFWKKTLILHKKALNTSFFSLTSKDYVEYPLSLYFIVLKLNHFQNTFAKSKQLLTFSFLFVVSQKLPLVCFSLTNIFFLIVFLRPNWEPWHVNYKKKCYLKRLFIHFLTLQVSKCSPNLCIFNSYII
jgi:hypothetical protein